MATAGGSAIDVHSKHALSENSAKEWDLKLGLDQGCACARAVTLVQLQSGGMWPGCDQPDRRNNRKREEKTGFGGGLECWPAAPSPPCTNSYTFELMSCVQKYPQPPHMSHGRNRERGVCRSRISDNVVSSKEPEIYQHQGSFQPTYVIKDIITVSVCWPESGSR